MREVQAPDGRVWRVRRRWLPRRPWLPREDAIDRGHNVYWWWGIGWLVWDRVVYPTLMLVGDLIFFAVSVPFVIAGRVLLLHPWRIEAATIGRPRRAREVEATGWRGSNEAIDRLANEIASGHA